MCTVLLRLLPDGDWPVQVAFVRDEDRSRRSDPPAHWWSDQPTVIGGRDTRAGGTWLAIDEAQPRAIALLTDQYDPAVALPDPTRSASRGTLPLLALEHGAHLELDAHAPQPVETYQPFHLVSIRTVDGTWRADRWSWTGEERSGERLTSGDHVIASRAPHLPGEHARREHLLTRMHDVPADAFSTDRATSAPDSWTALLDSRGAVVDQLDGVGVHSVSQRPGFGTVGASLVAISRHGDLRYHVNATTTLDPSAWTDITGAR